MHLICIKFSHILKLIKMQINIHSVRTEYLTLKMEYGNNRLSKENEYIYML